MSHLNTHKLFVATICLLLACSAFAQLRVEDYKGNALYRARNVMSGNLVRTTFYNYGLVGNIGEISGEWPIGTGDEYVGDVSPLVGVEFVHPSGDTLHSVTTSDGPRGNPDGPPGGGTFWGFEPLPGFAAAPNVGEDPKVAMSNQHNTWPDFWPDKMLTDSLDRNWQADPVDPGWSGHWNGYFGKDVTNADQESYFQMDDNSDLEWFQRTVDDSASGTSHTYYYYPAQYDTARRGLGLRVVVRGLQWSHFLAQDVIFWLYEITNVSSYTYDKVTFGMMVGTLSGGRQDSEDDLAYFDLENDITYSYDSDDIASPGWVPVSDTRNVGYVGYAFLESPGNPYDGIDNDGDSEDPGSPILDANTLHHWVDDSLRFIPGQTLVLTDYYTYERQAITFPQNGPLVYTIRQDTFQLFPNQAVIENGRNGIDDNFNGLIDERMDHVGLRFKDYFTGQGQNDILIDEARDDGIDNDSDWDPLTDDLGADGAALTGDPGEGDGMPTNGEPHFDKTDVDESDQIGLNAFDYFSPPGAVRMRDDEALWARMEPGHFDVVSGVPQDGDFIYGSGYFPLRPGQTERFSMALAYGEDSTDLADNKITVQQIYNENYNFARPPDKPTLWAVPGDGRVTLYWDDIAESSFDPVTGHDFEGYKIYRATDPAFNEVFTITDALGRRVFHKPIAQFDLNNGNAGIFPVIRNNVIYFLGNDSGLEHTWTDTTVENGQTYYYAIVAYDHGDVEKEILPAENSKTIVVDEAGNVTLDINTVQIMPRAPAAGYTPPQMSPLTHVAGNSTGAIAIELVDPRLVQDNRQYEFLFSEDADTSTPQDMNYSIVRHATEGTDTIVANRPLIPDDNLINQADRFAAYYDSLFNLPPGSYDPALYFRVAASDIFDGQRAYILIPRQVALIEQASGWADTTRHQYEFHFGLVHYDQYFLTGVPETADYRIEWYDSVVDTALYFNWFNLFTLPEVPVNFRVKNLNTGQYIHFAFDEIDSTTNGRVDHAEVVEFMNADSQLTWAVDFRSRAVNGDTVRPDSGDVLTLRLYQPYSSADRYEYSTSSARINSANVDLAKIRVYPNPYVAANPQEPRNPFNEGRGDRRLTFTHLPPDCKIRIYSVRGELVQTLEHRALDYSGSSPPPGYDPREHDEFEGTENWDLRSKDGLNVAYGVYLYHVESPYGETTGRFAVIK